MYEQVPPPFLTYIIYGLCIIINRYFIIFLPTCKTKLKGAGYDHAPNISKLIKLVLRQPHRSNFFPCERVSETSPVMLIGSLDEGFNLQQCNNMLNICQLTEAKCNNCWVLRHCNICVQICDNNGSLSENLKKSYCNQVRTSTEHSFRMYLALRELYKRMGLKESIS